MADDDFTDPKELLAGPRKECGSASVPAGLGPQESAPNPNAEPCEPLDELHTAAGGPPAGHVCLLVRIAPDPDAVLTALLDDYGLTVKQVAGDPALWAVVLVLEESRLRRQM